MKLKQVLLSTTLLFAVCFAAQSKTIDGSEAINLKDGQLSSDTLLVLTGEWNQNSISLLRCALHINGCPDNKYPTPNASLRVVDMSDMTFNSDVKSLDKLFSDVSDIETVKMPTKSISNSISLKSMFYGCEKLKGDIDLTAFKSISDLSSCFSYCCSIDNIKFSSIKNTNKISLFYAFYSCHKLSGVVDLSNIGQITDMKYTFYNCKNITGVKLPEEKNKVGVSFLCAFFGCTNMDGTIDLGNFELITDMGYAFANCKKINSVSLPMDNNDLSISFSNTFAHCANIDATIDLSPFKNISKMDSLACYCTKLPGILMSSEPNFTNVAMQGAFKGCSAIERIDLSSFKYVCNLSETFAGCTNLLDVKFNGVDQDNAMNTFFEANPSATKVLPKGQKKPKDWTNVKVIK